MILFDPRLLMQYCKNNVILREWVFLSFRRISV